MTSEEVTARVDESDRALAAKGRLLLTVELDSTEQAHEIMQWMYASDKPMKSTLLEISWDKVPIPKAQAEALEALFRSAR